MSKKNILAVCGVAYLKVECPVFVEIDDSAQDTDRAMIAEAVARELDGGTYVAEPDYWEEGEPTFEVWDDPSATPHYRVRVEDGGLLVDEKALPANAVNSADFSDRDEVSVALADGWSLRSGVYKPDDSDALTSGEYVRLCRPDGSEYQYWDQSEWQEDPGLVMGAIMNAAAGLRFTDAVEG
ncbi:hypothetical protein RM531_08250 [Salinisphaera sp. P385]|uniref:Uncharacterized protein n=1 Tax=Spectribacter acetivorans TaxID=3075603 RepID=A0ABU3BBW9_9GAMM|nr:hypothetical protein [Salinisphaera sp. P385]MDT0618466.1 hypothetical protein [Salinisphaera sp. P385]